MGDAVCSEGSLVASGDSQDQLQTKLFSHLHRNQLNAQNLDWAEAMCKGGISVVPSRSISGSLIDILQSRGEFPPSRNVLQQALSTCKSQVVYEETTPQDGDRDEMKQVTI